MNWQEKARSLVKDSRHDHQYKEGFVELLRCFHDMAKRLDEALTMEKGAGGRSLNLIRVLTPPEEPKEELPGKLSGLLNDMMGETFDKIPGDDISPVRDVFKFLLSHIKSELNKTKESFLESVQRLIDSRDQSWKSELDKRDENLKEWTEDLLTRRFEFHIRNHNHRPTGQKEG